MCRIERETEEDNGCNCNCFIVWKDMQANFCSNNELFLSSSVWIKSEFTLSYQTRELREKLHVNWAEISSERKHSGIKNKLIEFDTHSLFRFSSSHVRSHSLTVSIKDEAKQQTRQREREKEKLESIMLELLTDARLNARERFKERVKGCNRSFTEKNLCCRINYENWNPLWWHT